MPLLPSPAAACLLGWPGGRRPSHHGLSGGCTLSAVPLRPAAQQSDSKGCLASRAGAGTRCLPSPERARFCWVLSGAQEKGQSFRVPRIGKLYVEVF